MWPEMTLGMYLSVWWVTLFLRVSYWGQVVEMNFCLIFVKLVILISCWRFFLSLPAESYVMNMYSPCITILEYTSQNKKFENFINIHFNKKTLRRSWITHFKKQPQEVFYKKAVLKNLAIFTTRKHFWWSLFLIKLQTLRPVALLQRDSNTAVFLWEYCKIFRNISNLKIISKRLLLPLEVFL